MAKFKRNNATSGLSGKVDQFVYTQRFGKTYVSKPGLRGSNSSPAQLAVQELFREATIYAKSMAGDPTMFQFYKDCRQPHQTVYNIALADYCKAPEIKAVNTAGYTGVPGEFITIKAIDNYEVDSVVVKISKNGALLESGNAQQAVNQLLWNYPVTASNPSLSGTVLTITVTDKAGRETEEQFNL